MGEVNVVLKRSYACVISLIGVIAILALGFTLFGHGTLFNHEKADHAIKGFYIMYGFSSATLLFAIVGAFGVCKEKKWPLIVFAVGMILGCLYFIVTEIFLLVTVPQVKKAIEDEYLGMLPLSNFNESDLLEFHDLQREYHCCGLTSFQDWENSVPESCECGQDSTDSCVDNSRPSNDIQDILDPGPRRIYAKPCLPLMIQQESWFIHLALGITMGFISLWMLSVGLCIAILCQMNRKVKAPNVGSPKVSYLPEPKARTYSILNEALEEA
ncbi:tetraspanin-6 [Fundulus heteroclitus]|uniref:tetraspanin-6 n=1 Tax=Fundulus heteroclitus TaxID=8078 RepID=UPI00165AF232|nr:tetraspanin-6 [Fundulus heteroclitus]